MISFGYVYIRDEMVVYDITTEETANYTTYVASLSSDPSVSFRSNRAQTAITRLLDHLHAKPAPTLDKVVWLPATASRSARKAAAAGF